MEPVEIKWTPNELVEYVSNLSAYVAQTLSLDGSVAFNINTLTEDNKATFLNEEINEAVNQLVPHFSRIISDDKDIINTTDGVGFEITPRIEGGSYSKAELSHIKTLSRKLVASYILADWYTVKGIVAMSNYFTTQYAQAGVELDRVLDRFIRPVRRAGVSINRVTYSTKPSQNLVHINNKSDFVLVWSSKDGSALPNGEFDIDFFTDGDVVYSVNSLDAQYVKPIEGENGKVRIIFDFSREGANYFANGVLKYNMYGEATDSDFPDGKRHYEISGETNIEIWSGASDTDGDMFASYVPLYAKLTFEDLTEEDIAVLQTPALEAANTANAAAQYANEMGQFADAQGNAASNAAIQANSAVADARDAIEEVEKTNDTIKTAESERIKQWGNLSESINNAIDSAYQNSSAANAAAKKAEKAYEDVSDLADEITEAEKLREQNTTAAIEAANTAAENTNEATANANAAAERANEIADGIQDDLAKKADIDKSYPKMTAGFAQEIVGDGSATPEEFSFRPTAGEDRNVANTTYYEGERNGVARIEKIKGNSVVHNQLLANDAKFGYENENAMGFWFVRSGADSYSLSNNGITLHFGRTTKIPSIGQYVGVKKSHKYLINMDVIFNGQFDEWGRSIYMGFGVNSIDTTAQPLETFLAPYRNLTQFSLQFIVEANVDAPYFTIAIRNRTINNGEEFYTINNAMIVDLTREFTAGNEPTTVEEFYQRLPKGIDISEYNEGEIIDGNYGAIKTTGFNQWDEQWELGGINTTTGKLFNANTRIRSKNYNPALPNTPYVFSMPTGQPILIFWYDSNYQFISYNYYFDQSASKISPSNARYFKILLYDTYGTTYKNDICINIAWDEYAFMNGMYQPYKPFEKDLSWVNKYFPTTINGETKYGMRSAGSVRDEIRFNSITQKWEAVQNVGVRAYAEGDSEDTSVTTDGTNTNYALATPIITEISEDVNLDFDVSDYGTEELIVEEGKASAPIVADISYAPNALSTLKQVPDILKRLKALESAVASATAITNKEETVE